MESTHSARASRTGVLVLAAVVLLFLALQATPIRQVHVAQYDESIFLDIARNIRETGLPLRSVGPDGRLFDQTPGYPYWLSLLTAVAGEDLTLLRLATVAAGIGSLIAVYAIASREGGPAAGVVAALLLALSPFVHLYSYFLRMEVYMVFCLMLATWWLARPDPPTRRNLLLAGAAIAAAVLFKIVALAYLLAASIWLLWRLRRRGDAGRWFGDLAALILPAVVGLGLWGAVMISDARGLETILARWGSASGIAAGPVDPRQGTAALAWLRQVGCCVAGWELTALAVAALLSVPLLRRVRPGLAPDPLSPVVWLLLLYVVLALGASLVVSLKEPRHLIGLIPAAALVVALCVNWARLWAWAVARPLTAIGAAALGVWLLFGMSPLRLPLGPERATAAAWWDPLLVDRYFYNDPRLDPIRQAGEYLRLHSPVDAVIVAVRQGPVVGYYADRSYIFLYTRPYAENVALLRDNDYLVFDRQEFWAQTPEETESLLRLIAEEFVVEADFSTADAQAVVFRRADAPAVGETASP
jgi:4-amino-4-deoxy-L-arabinose transferase-like glycosyltransferase